MDTWHLAHLFSFSIYYFNLIFIPQPLVESLVFHNIFKIEMILDVWISDKNGLYRKK